jgi:hypothetical protein
MWHNWPEPWTPATAGGAALATAMTTVERAESDGDLRTFKLVFEGVTCDECDQTYPVNQTCGCGTWTPRDDVHSARRRAAVAEIQSRLIEPVEPTTPITIVEGLEVVSPWIADFFEGLNLLGEDGADASLVDQQIGTLLDLRGHVAAVPRRRPWLAIWDPFTAVLDSLAALAQTYVEAAVAADPQGAETLEVVGQSHLDDATVQIGVLNTRADFWGLARTIRLPDSIVAAAAAAYEATGAENLLDLERRGMFRYKRISGKEEGPIGVGIGLALDLGLVDRALDEKRVFAVARATYERIDKYRRPFLALASDAGWRGDLLNARRLFYESQLSAETLLRELAGERRLEAEAVLRLGGRLTERVSAAIVGLVVASDSSTHLRRTADYTEILIAAKAADLGDLLLGFDDRIRNADAHSDYDVGDDFVILGRNRSKPERVGDEELVDIVLAAVESCAAIFAAIDCVLLEEGHPASQDRAADFEVVDLVTMLLAASGVTASRVEFAGNRLNISGSTLGMGSAVNPLTVIAALSPHLPPETNRVALHLKRQQGTVVADVVLEPLRRSHMQDGVAKDAAFIEFMGRAKLNGRPVLPPRHVRFLMAYHAVPLLNMPLSELEERIGHLAAAARHLNDRDLAAALQATVVMKRAQEGGPPAPAALRRVYERLADYVRRPPGSWNDGSGTGGLTVA